MKYFSEKELQCKETGKVCLHPTFEIELPKYREALGFPLYVNSCCRSREYNALIGGSPRSYHLFEGVDDGREGTLAIDLRVKNDKKRVIMVQLALEMGWSVGVYNKFIHIDRRVDIGKPQVCFWGKY